MATSCVTCIPIDGVTIDGSYVHNNGALMSKPNVKTEAILNVSIRTIDGVGVRNDPYARYADDEFVFIRDPITIPMTITEDVSRAFHSTLTSPKVIPMTITEDVSRAFHSTLTSPKVIPMNITEDVSRAFHSTLTTPKVIPITI